MRSACSSASARICAMISAPCRCASARIRAASSRASASWARYSSSVRCASACACSACLMPPSIAAVRSAYVRSKTGRTYLRTKKNSTPNATKPMMISAVCGISGFGSSASCASRTLCAVNVTMTVPTELRVECECEADTDDGQRLGEREAQDGDAQQDELAAEDGEQKHQVSGEHVEGETEGERDRPDDDRGEELQRREQRIDRLRHTGREHHVLEVAAEALPLDADVVEDDPRDHREPERDRDPGRGRELDERDDARDVQHREEDEQREQVRDVFGALFADGVR